MKEEMSSIKWSWYTKYNGTASFVAVWYSYNKVT